MIELAKQIVLAKWNGECVPEDLVTSAINLLLEAGVDSINGEPLFTESK